MLTFTPTDNLEAPVNLKCLSLEWKLKYRGDTQTQGKHTNTQKGPRHLAPIPASYINLNFKSHSLFSAFHYRLVFAEYKFPSSVYLLVLNQWSVQKHTILFYLKLKEIVCECHFTWYDLTGLLMGLDMGVAYMHVHNSQNYQ